MNQNIGDSQLGSTHRSWRTLAHLLAFGLLLALAMVLVRGAPGSREAANHVIFSEADVMQASAKFMRTWNRPPSEVELRNVIGQYIREEILYREALARGLDRGDPVVRMTLVRKITMMGTAQAETAELTDQDVQAYFSLRQERYRIPTVVSIMQVYLSREKRGESVRADAEQLLDSFKQREPRPEELTGYGDPTMLNPRYTEMSVEDLDRTFGAGFGQAVMELPPDRWEGPIESGYGFHLVKLTRREESRIPDWTEIADRIITDMRYEARKAAEDQLYSEIAPRYQIVYDDAVAALLEGGTP